MGHERFSTHGVGRQEEEEGSGGGTCVPEAWGSRQRQEASTALPNL